MHRICAQAQPSPTKSVSSLAAASVNSENKLDQQIDHRSLGIKSDQCPAVYSLMIFAHLAHDYIYMIC